ncbi:MAG: hypothetical protein HGA22_06070 [Clostridiales bacterium]|nr:hypothetical protein [Clostridiales bacterium]
MTEIISQLLQLTGLLLITVTTAYVVLTSFIMIASESDRGSGCLSMMLTRTPAYDAFLAFVAQSDVLSGVSASAAINPAANRGFISSYIPYRLNSLLNLILHTAGTMKDGSPGIHSKKQECYSKRREILLCQTNQRIIINLSVR